MKNKKVATIANIILIISLLLAVAFFGQESLVFFEQYRWYILFAFVALSLFTMPEKQTTPKQNSEILNEVIASHPWIKVYLVGYCFILAIFIYRSLSSGQQLIDSQSDYFIIQLMLIIMGLGLPFFLASTIETFKK